MRIFPSARLLCPARLFGTLEYLVYITLALNLSLEEEHKWLNLVKTPQEKFVITNLNLVE